MKILKLFILFLFGLTLFGCNIKTVLVEREIEKNLSRFNYEILKDGKLHVILVGSGGPMNNPERLPTCTAIIAGGEFILVDLGAGTIRNADLQNLAMGRNKALDVFGPEGIKDVVDGYNLAYKHDTSYRIAHHGVDIFPPEACVPVAKTIRLAEKDGAELFFDRNGLKAYAFRVDHSPATPSYGYRFEYKGNVVVISGDTKKIDNLTKHAKNADIFICEGLRMELVKRVSDYAEKTGRPRIGKMLFDTLDYHIDPVDAGKVAKEANAKKLVFNHIVPPVTNFLVKRIFLDGVDDVYDGDIVMGEDGMEFILEPKQ
ncbi:MAG: MBL fold metallo-hydrolase [Deltaproteobacteria bacterium]|nr:MBL fold metallo-hydrolase [Deltaproteobacteria bacterium]